MTSFTDRKLTPLERVLARITPEMQHRVDNRMMMAARIADAMEEKGISQKQLAKQLGKPQSMIPQWLSGTQNFTMDTLSDIEHILGIQLLQLEERQPLIIEFHFVIDQPATPKGHRKTDNEMILSSSKMFLATSQTRNLKQPTYAEA